MEGFKSSACSHFILPIQVSYPVYYTVFVWKQASFLLNWEVIWQASTNWLASNKSMNLSNNFWLWLFGTPLLDKTFQWGSLSKEDLRIERLMASSSLAGVTMANLRLNLPSRFSGIGCNGWAGTLTTFIHKLFEFKTIALDY